MAAIFKPQYTKTDPATGRKQKRRLKKWYVKYRDASGVVKRVPGYTDKEATRQLAAQLERQAAQEASGMVDRYTEHRKRPLAEHLEDYRRFLESKGNTDKHVSMTVRQAQVVLEGSAARYAGDLSPSMVTRYLHDRRRAGLSIASSNHHLTAVKGFARWLVRDGRRTDNPLAHLSSLNVKTDRRHVRRNLDDDEFNAFPEATRNGKSFRGLSGQDREMLYAVAAYTGLRVSELASLVPTSFDLTGHPPPVTVEAGYSKRRREDVLPLQSGLAARLKAWGIEQASGQPCSPALTQNGLAVCTGHVAAENEVLWAGTWPDCSAAMIRFDLASAGIAYRDESDRVFDFHALRHQFISNLAKSGAHPKVAQQLARHSTITLTMDHYTHLRLADLTPALEALRSLPTQNGNAETATETGTVA